MSDSIESLLCVEYMAMRTDGRTGRDGKEETRGRGNGERMDGNRRGFIWSRAISRILCEWESVTAKHVVIPDPRRYARAVSPI